MWDSLQPSRTWAREQNVQGWKIIPSSAVNAVTRDTSLCVIVIREVCDESQESWDVGVYCEIGDIQATTRAAEHGNRRSYAIGSLYQAMTGEDTAG
jgi:hypothetical protein